MFLRTLLVGYVLVASGIGSRYASGKFETVIRNRQRYGQLPLALPENIAGYMALPYPEDIGKVFLVCFEDGECDWLLVADCAGIGDGGLAWMLNGGVAAEVDHKTAERHSANSALPMIWVYKKVPLPKQWRHLPQ
jgi:hypothetical protein